MVHSVEIAEFSVIQILREINFGESRSCNGAYFAILVPLNCVEYVNFSVQKLQKLTKNQNSEPPIVLKWQFLNLNNHQL